MTPLKLPVIEPTALSAAEIATLQSEIKRLAKERNAVILAHNYQRPEIQDVADYVGDSLGLARQGAATKSEVIVFCGVHFMAETAVILSPEKKVLLPDLAAGCSLADQITGEDVRKWRARFPDHVAVGYVNTTADVKAESDVCVTSGNVYDIVARLPQRRILFVPDRLMGENIRSELKRRGIDKEIITSDGTCIVHDVFDAAAVADARARFPGLKVVAHPECTPEIAAMADFVGSTGAMMKYVKTTPAPYYLMLTECGLVGRLQVETPEKHFIGGCRLCPYMKLNSLEKVRDALLHPRPFPSGPVRG